MDKNQLYFNYMKENSEYYEKTESYNSSIVYKVTNIPDNCIVIKENSSPWKFYNFKNQQIKDQGWKIHVSSTLYNAQEILNGISEVLLAKQIPFKHINDEFSLLNINSKNGNRISSGKFITIYPPTDDTFLNLLDTLYEIVKDKENGPYILSDKCWRDSNVFYRYGGFISILNEKGEACIKDPEGNLVPDQRTPYYQVPEFVKDFDIYLDSKNNLTEDEEDKQKLSKYEFKNVFRYTNGGGIYLAERVTDKTKVVIKEARPKAGLDGQKRDAVDRLKVEYETLTKLSEVEGVVNVIDYFRSWKHHFLVEEYVEGFDLKTWLSVKYPFHRENDKYTYLKDIKKIILSLIKIVSEMHNKNVGMGDLQPSNIIIDQDLNVKLIDFESAEPIDINTKPALHTVGFANKMNENHRERDWYAIKKILRYCLLPIGPISDLDESILSIQNQWIEREFGRDIYLFVKEIENKCDKYLSKTKGKEFITNNKAHKNLNEEVILLREGLTKGMIKNFIPEDRLIYGDIRQYELPDGNFNVYTGGTGAALALARSGSMNTEVYKWIEDHLLNKVKSITQEGLFTGKAGIAATIYELGYKEEALMIFDNYLDNLNAEDISLRSGLAGVGLTYVSLYFEEGNESYLLKATSIATNIKSFIDNKKTLASTDWAGVPIGLMDGLSGVALFFTSLYSVTRNQEYYEIAIELLERDLKNTRLDTETNILQTIDERDRLLPYLSGGTIGIGVALWFLNHVSGENLFHKELKSISNLNDIRCTFSGGLFDGIGGFLLLPIIQNDSVETYEKNIKDAIEKLNLFILRREDEFLYSGNFCYRLSHDLYSGSSGIILALNAIIKSNPLSWIPIVNIDNFIVNTSLKKVVI